MKDTFRTMVIVAVMIVSVIAVATYSDSSDAATIGDISNPGEVTNTMVDCTVGETEYHDFNEAINAATNGDNPIVLKSDYYHSGEISLTGFLSIDLSGYILEVDNIVVSGSGSLTISNGTLYGKLVDDMLHATLTSKDSAQITLKDVDFYTNATGAIVYDKSSITVSEGTVIHAKGFGLGTNAGEPDNYEVKITITDSAVYADSNPTTAGTAILFNVPGTLKIENSTIQGYYQAVIVRGGNAEISGSTITNTLNDGVTIETFDSEDWRDGNAVPTSALVIGNKSTAYQYPTSVNITDTQVTTDGSQAGSVSTVVVSANPGNDLGVELEYDSKTTFTNTGKTGTASDISYDLDDGNIVLDYPVAAVGGNEYSSLQEAIDAAESGKEKTVTLVNDIRAGSWNMIWEISGITIDGNGYTIKVNGIESGSNYDAVLHSTGGNTFKDMTFDLSGITTDSTAQGYRAICAFAGDTVQNVNVIGNKYVDYGITVGGSGSGSNSILIEDCTFKDCDYGVYSDYPADLETLTIQGCDFEGCGYAAILYPEDSTFTGNTVVGGKLNVMHEGQIITDNKFEDHSRIKFFGTGAEFDRNAISEDSYLALDVGVTAVDISGNYWGGGEPSTQQLGNESGNFVWTNYYLDANMTTRSDDPVTEPGTSIDDDDEFVPPYIPQQSSDDDDSTLYIACCAAAAVVALLAIIIVMNERRR